MDFFARQDAAQRKSSRLALFFALAVVVIVGGVYAIAVVVTGFTGHKAGMLDWWQPETLLFVVVGVGGIIFLGSLYKTMGLRQGGSAVASLLGGTPVPPNTTDVDERKLLNVVEEMAIASGTAMPEVYLLPNELSINAFAAGYTPSDAAIGVTRGCVEKLSRDELQGVVAHEFSHILHGDMRLNIRLIGLLHGILVIGLIGIFLLRSSVFAGGARRSNRNSGGAVVAILGVGATMMVLGYAGVFFGRLIKAAVSRQREFLADASAVQFTRNPDGIAGALKKIGGYNRGSRLETPRAEEASHMFFGNSTKKRWLFRNVLATHPPLEERIKAIEPRFEGELATIDDSYRPPSEEGGVIAGLAGGIGGASGGAAAAAGGAVGAAATGVAPPEVTRDAVTPGVMMGQIGSPTPAHVAWSHALLDSLPPAVRQATHEPFGARAVVYCLLLDPNDDIRQNQLAALRAAAESPVYAETLRLARPVAMLRPEARLPLIDIALPALRRLSPAQISTFGRNVETLIAADQKVSLFEFALRKVLMRHLARHQRAQSGTGSYNSLVALREELQISLSTLAYAGHGSPEAAQTAYSAAVSRLGTDLAGLGMAPPSVCSLSAFDYATERLNLLQPRLKQAVLAAATECVASDGKITVEEAELVRAIADTLDCPMPPLIGDGWRGAGADER